MGGELILGNKYRVEFEDILGSTLVVTDKEKILRFSTGVKVSYDPKTTFVKGCITEIEDWRAGDIVESASGVVYLRHRGDKWAAFGCMDIFNNDHPVRPLKLIRKANNES